MSETAVAPALPREMRLEGANAAVGVGDAGLDLPHHVGAAFGPAMVFEHPAVAAETPAGDLCDGLGVAAGRVGGRGRSCGGRRLAFLRGGAAVIFV